MPCTRCDIRRFIARRGWTVARLCQEIDAPQHEANIAKWLRGKALLDDAALSGRVEALMRRLESPPNP